MSRKLLLILNELEVASQKVRAVMYEQIFEPEKEIDVQELVNVRDIADGAVAECSALISDIYIARDEEIPDIGLPLLRGEDEALLMDMLNEEDDSEEYE